MANAARRLILRDGVTDVGCSLKAYRADFLRGVPVFDGFHRLLPALTQLKVARVSEVSVHHRPRRFGDSNYGIHNRLWRTLMDLLGVRWLQSRGLDLELTSEIEVGVEGGSAELPPLAPGG